MKPPQLWRIFLLIFENRKFLILSLAVVAIVLGTMKAMVHNNADNPMLTAFAGVTLFQLLNLLRSEANHVEIKEARKDLTAIRKNGNYFPKTMEELHAVLDRHLEKGCQTIEKSCDEIATRAAERAIDRYIAMQAKAKEAPPSIQT